MEQTSRLSIVIDTGNAQRALQNLRRDLADLERSGSNLATRFSAMSSSANHLTGATNATTSGLNRMGGASATASRGLANVSRSAGTASGQVQILGSRLSDVQNRLSSLHGLIAGGIFVGAGLSIAKTADQMQGLNSQVKLVTASHEEYVAVNERLHQMANKNLTDISATTGLYTNSARALGNLGKSQQEVLTFTNAVSLAMGVGGKSANEQASAILQLGQAMQSGVVQGDEFRSLAENAPIILDLVAESLGKTRGEVRELSKEGEITAEVMYDALANATPKLQAMFDQMPVTMAQAFGVLRNNYKKFVGDFVNDTTGLAGMVSKSLLGIANDFETLAKGSIAVAGVALASLASRVTLTTTAFSALGKVIMAHPVVAMTAGVVALASAFYGLDDVLNITGIIFSDLFGVVTTGLRGLSDLTEAVAFNISNSFKGSTEQTSQGFALFFANTQSGFAGLIQGVLRILASAISTIGGFFKWVTNGVYQAGRAFGNLVIAVGNVIKATANSVSQAVISMINGAIDQANGMIQGLNNALALTPFNIRMNIIPKIAGTGFNFKQSEYLSLSGDSLSANISRVMDDVMPVLDGYGASLSNRVQDKKATADLTKAMGANTQATNANTKEQKGGKNGKGGGSNGSNGSNGSKGDKYTYTTRDIEALKRVQGLIYGSDLKKYAEQKGVPVHMLAGLMMQESRGEQYAKSPTGAIGYFQTTSGYRKDMGMSRNDSYDLIKSGTKAIDFLAQSYKEFGDWESAIRSYNAGRGGTRQFNRTGQVEGSEARNKEVRGYVPKINKWSAWFNSGNGGLGKDQDVSKQNQAFLENEQKNLEELAKMREQIEVRFMDGYTKQRYELLNQLEEINKAGFDENTATEWKQFLKYRFDETQAYHKKSTDLELNGYRLNTLEKLKIEKELAQQKIILSTELSLEEKAIHYQAIEDKYAFDVEQYQLAQQKKVDEFKKAFEQTRNSGYMAEYNDVMYQKYLSPHEYNKWQLDRTHESNKSDEEGRYNDVLKSINEKDETGNFVIADFNERSRLLQEAKIIHEEQMYAIAALYGEKTRQLEADNLSMTLQGYSSTFGALSGLIKGYAGEQSGIYRAMFAAEKGMALARVLLQSKVALANAWASAPFPANLPIVATTAIETGVLAGAISAINPIIGQAHDGIMSVPKSGTWNLEKGERVLPKHTAQSLDKKLDGMGNGKPVNVIIHNHSNAQVAVEEQPNGDLLVMIDKMIDAKVDTKVNQRFIQARRQGGELYGR